VGGDPVAVAKAELVEDLARLDRAKAGVLGDFPRRLDISLEALRVLAFICFQSSHTREAIAYQKAAAEWYHRLEIAVHPYRRGADAETDAFYRLARMNYETDPPDFAEASRAICEAERYAVLGIRHEKVALPEPALGFVGGEVVPTEYPERLRPLWRLSAILHMAVGDWRDLDMRILASIPQEQWTPESLRREKAMVAQIACLSLSKLPINKRPTHYHQLCQMVDKATTMQATTAPAQDSQP